MIWRYRVTFFFLAFSFFVILSRLFYWQIVKANELSSWGKLQYQNQYTLLPKRGEIETSDSYPIATNQISYLLFANPSEIKKEDVQKTSTLLSSILSIDQASISAKLSENLLWVSLVSSIDNTKKEVIDNLKLPGIGFEEQDSRFYPEASVAAQLIGFVAKDEQGGDKGYFGIEGFYDRELRGKEGIGIQIHDAFGRPILAKFNDDSGAVDGRTIKTSIDRAIQFLVEKKLTQGIQTYGAVSGMVGIMDPHTGAIIAMASSPSFDPRDFQNYSEDLYKNPFISNTYEPGSTFKPLVMAAAIDNGLVKPDTKCPICGGPITIDDYTIRTWNDQYFKDTTMTKVIQHSDNTGMVYVAKTLGLTRLLSSLNAFGIGNLTGIDLQGEVALSLRDESSWYPIDVATAGFGQGISVTPIELLSAFSTIANDGKRMQPYVVSQIMTPDGQIITIDPKVLNQPISASTAKIMTQMLVNAVDNGEAKWAKPKGYRIAGKTGTAQIPIAGHYDPNKTIASFIGFAPSEDPKFAMLVIINQPSTSIYGAETAAPIFFDIAKDLFDYYKIPPN